MNFEVLQKSHLKRNVLIGIAVIFVISACILTFSLAKYRNTKSIQIAKGTINYIPYDLNVLAIYAEGEKQEEIPSGNYILSDQSYCTVDNKKDDSITLTYESSTQTLSITPMKKEGTKCTLYFSRVLKDAIVADNGGAGAIEEKGTPNFSEIATTDEGMYKAEDNDGSSYYYRGAVDNNWVQFAGFYWRIIRINGDGSIRMIYSGIDSGSITDANRTGSTTTIGQSVFNEEYDQSEYAGLKYTLGEQHGATTESTILTKLNTWYNESMKSYEKVIDTKAKFCIDREVRSSDTWYSMGGSFFYAAYDRLSKGTPTLNCSNENDILEIPVGLITADEAAIAGGKHGTNNSDYYLNVGAFQWTMSPFYYNKDYSSILFEGAFASTYLITNNGKLGNNDAVAFTAHTRPVINLHSDVTISSGNGTSTNPYQIEEIID